MTSRPNILYLHSHDTGRCIQPSVQPTDRTPLDSQAIYLPGHGQDPGAD